MRRISSIVLLASALPLAALGQAAPTAAVRPRPAGLAGRLTDAKTGDALLGVNVVFPDLKQGTATDAEGRFSFANLPRGRFTVQVTALGYNTISQLVDTGSGQALDFQLALAATEIGQVVVTGVSQATEL
ncbi:MAG: carboxypeptidase-like regulatory domain-containing protein, partial [Cytophagaceae bacterium]